MVDAKLRFMFSPPGGLAIGPVRCAWTPHRRGTPAEALARPWLAEVLGMPAPELPLQRDARGRPRLGVAGTDASWSHSGEQLLVALGTGVQVGADLELLRPRPRALELAARFFAPAESQALAALPAGTREAAFVRLWCAKEAVLKAHGHGLSFGLDRVVFAERAGTLVLAAADAALGDPAAWSLHEFAPHPGYRAALAWRAPGAA